MQYDHLCHSTGNAAAPCLDCTTCCILSISFSDAPEFIETLSNIIVVATAHEISTDDLLVMVESIGQAKLDHPQKNLQWQLLQSLKTYCAHTHHHSMGSTPAFDIFHDLLYGFEQCNTATLVSIMGRHHITPPHTKLKHDDMKMAILTHILEGHCIINERDIFSNQQSHTPCPECEDVHHAIDPSSNIPDNQMKVAILETMKDELPCLPMLHLFRIQGIDHNAEDSLNTL